MRKGSRRNRAARGGSGFSEITNFAINYRVVAFVIYAMAARQPDGLGLDSIKDLSPYPIHFINSSTVTAPV